ncbi:MAG TPA: hypothetical protein VIY69_16225 [Candidatus Acidoferrales bacterium]
MRDVDKVIAAIKRLSPDVCVEQLKVLHPGADDDGIWFFAVPASGLEVQIESPDGMCPFLVETNENDERLTTASAEATVHAVRRILHLTDGS